MRALGTTLETCNEARKGFNEKSDCVVKALAITTQVDYATVHAMLAKHGRKARCGTWNRTTFAAARELGFTLTEIKHFIYNERCTVRSIEPKLKDGFYLVMTRSHALAVVDGVVHDYTRGKTHKVTEVYRVTRAGEPVITAVAEDGAPVYTEKHVPVPRHAISVKQWLKDNEDCNVVPWGRAAQWVRSTGRSLTTLKVQARKLGIVLA